MFLAVDRLVRISLAPELDLRYVDQCVVGLQKE
jgi:hypothetical protein